jgi:hypothetical protein
MRKFLISIATTASVLAIASPASAQYYGGGYGSNNGYGYNNGYGFNNGSGYNEGYGYNDRHRSRYDSRNLVAANRQRMARIEYQIRSLEAQGRISPREANSLERRAAQFRRELDAISRNGMTGNEGAIFDARVGQLGRQVEAYAGYRNGSNRW